MSDEVTLPPPAPTIGDRVRALREERGFSLSQLADLAQVSKSSLHEIENNPKSRPAAETLYNLALVLDTTVGYLLGRQRMPPVFEEAEGPLEIPPSLEEFARKNRIPEDDKRRLACIKYRGMQPQRIEDWAFIYEAIKRSTQG